MAHSRIIAPVNACIAYIESCGWKLRTREGRWYRFDRATPATTGSTTNEVSFTLSQIRDAFNHGW
jgi:hypothetical protein